MNREALMSLQKISIDIILKNQSDSGAYIASPNFSVYNYCWFRDGAFIADAMLASGELESAVKFHSWATQVINARRDKISELVLRKREGQRILPEEHLHCRFTLDGLESNEDWTNFQLDGFGTWLWALDEFANKGQVIPEVTLTAVQSLIEYLCAFWDEPSFDWWEESFGHQHVSTLVCIGTGLERCAKWDALPKDLRDRARLVADVIRRYILDFGVKGGHLTKWIGSEDLDGSLSACISPLHYFEPNSEIAKSTLDAVATELKMFGTYRHKNDVYFGGGSWIILSAFLGLGFAEAGEISKATSILNWISESANQLGELPEQLNNQLLFPAFEAEWIKKWGESAVPLLWSHAMFLKLYRTVSALGGDSHAIA